MRTMLFGAEANSLAPALAANPPLERVEHSPDVIICYGGDGTLLAAELCWPGVPKVPIRNSRRGARCMSHPPEEIITRLAKGELFATKYMKLDCRLRYGGQDEDKCQVSAMNEVNVHMGHVNSAVRFKIWIDDIPYENGQEIIGDGFVCCTPFGSTAYFRQITRGILYTGIGLGLKFPISQTDHVVVPDTTVIRAEITRGPAVLAYDNSPEYYDLKEGDEVTIQKGERPATILTWEPMRFPSDAF